MATEYRPIPRLAVGVYPLTNVTPFTYRDGVTYEKLLHQLIDRMNTIIGEVNTNNQALFDVVIENMNITIDAVNAALGEQTEEVDQKLADLTEYVDVEVAKIVDMRNEMVEYRDETEAFRNQAEVFSATTVELQDAAVAALIDTPGSDTRTQLDSTVATLIDTPGSDTRTQLNATIDEVAINVAANPGGVQAAIDSAPDGSRLLFPASMSPVMVPSGGFILKSNNLTIDAMGVEFQVSDWGTPAFLALRANGGADGHTYRIGMVRYVGTRGDHTGSPLRGSAPYCSGCGVWSNGDRNFVEYLRTVGMPTPIFFSSWDGTSQTDRTGTGNRIGYLEATQYNFALLYVKQEAFDWGNAYCHDDLDDSSGVNPTHAIYCSASSGHRAGEGTIGRWLTRNNMHGAPYQFKYSDGVTADQLLAEGCGGLVSVQSCTGFTANVISGTALAPPVMASRHVEFVGTDHCSNIHVGKIVVDKALNADAEAVSLWVDDMCEIGSISVVSRNSGSVNVNNSEVLIRGIGMGNIANIQVSAIGTAMRPVRFGDGTNVGRAVGWMVPDIRSVGAGAALDAIPANEENHCYSNAWGDGGGFLSGFIPARGIYRRGMRWGASAPSVGVARGWVQTVNGALSGSTWAATTAVAVAAWVKLADGRVIRYLTAGTTGASEPNPTTIGETGTDGTATWEYMSATSGTVVSQGNL